MAALSVAAVEMAVDKMAVSSSEPIKQGRRVVLGDDKIHVGRSRDD